MRISRSAKAPKEEKERVPPILLITMKPYYDVMANGSGERFRELFC
jgi:hypothetical protein